MNSYTPRHQSVLMEGSLEAVFESVLPEIEALKADDLPIVNVDIASAVTQTLGVLPGMGRYREVIRRQLVEFDLVRFDKLETYAKALLHAHRQHLIATQPPDELKSLFEECRELRELLLKDATTLAARNFFSAEALDDLRGTNGYKNAALDLQQLVGVLRGSWSKIEGKCALSKEELEYADQLAMHLMRIYGVREQTSGGTARTSDLRLRAYALFVSAYEDARRAIYFLRWREGDAELIAPTLLASRAPAKKKADPSTSGEADREVREDGPGTPDSLSASFPQSGEQSPQPNHLPKVADPSGPFG